MFQAPSNDERIQDLIIEINEALMHGFTEYAAELTKILNELYEKDNILVH